MALSLGLLAAVYLFYLPHADYVLDDWFHLDFYRRAVPRLETLRQLFDNQLYGGVQLFFLSQWINAAQVWVFGYAPRIAFGVLLVVHTASAWLLFRLLMRLRVDPRAAYLAGACFLVIPTAHGPLFWPLNCSFYVWPMLWLLLYLLAVWRAIESGRLGVAAAAVHTVLILATLFSGSPAFALLLLGPAWLAVCFAPRAGRRTAVAVVLLNWAVVAAALSLYPPFSRERREDADPRIFLNTQKLQQNAQWLGIRLTRLSGVTPGAYYRVGLTPEPALVGAAAMLLLLGVGRRFRPDPEARSAARVVLFAAGMSALAYAPVAGLDGQTLRHYYTFSPFVALLGVILVRKAVGRFRESWGLAAAAALAGYFTSCTVAEIRQCWIVQSKDLQAIKLGLRQLPNLAPHDIVIIPRARTVVGTAPHFALIAPPWDWLFAKQITGVPYVEFWREIVVEQGYISLFHRGFMRGTDVADLAAAHVLAGGPGGPYRPLQYWAEAVGKNTFRLHCLRGSACVAPPAPLTSEQIGRHDHIYFPRPFEHGDVAHLHY